MSDVFPGKHGKVGFDGIGADAARAASGVMSRGIALALCLTEAARPTTKYGAQIRHKLSPAARMAVISWCRARLVSV